MRKFKNKIRKKVLPIEYIRNNGNKKNKQQQWNGTTLLKVTRGTPLSPHTPNSPTLRKAKRMDGGVGVCVYVCVQQAPGPARDTVEELLVVVVVEVLLWPFPLCLWPPLLLPPPPNLGWKRR